MQIGLVGLQYSGKTTLFNSLLGKPADENLTVKEEASIEVVKVPDARLDKLTQIFNPKKQVNATIEVFDFPGLRTSDDGKVKITNAFLNSVRNNDAIFYVIRQFAEESVPHPLNRIDPAGDLEFLETEFLLSDYAFLENRMEKLLRDIKKSGDDNLKKELPVIEKCIKQVEEEKPLRGINFDANDIKLLSGYQLLTLKPVAAAVNLDENLIGNEDEFVKDLSAKLKNGINIIPFFAKIEHELSLMQPDDREMFMQDYGLKESALNKILRTSYKILGLQSFFTVGEDECRAWTIKNNYTAQDSAGVIHTDFYNKFIRAEVVHYKPFIEYGSFAKCKEAGVWSLEGKEYLVKDGDILNIRHS